MSERLDILNRGKADADTVADEVVAEARVFLAQGYDPAEVWLLIFKRWSDHAPAELLPVLIASLAMKAVSDDHF